MSGRLPTVAGGLCRWLAPVAALACAAAGCGKRSPERPPADVSIPADAPAPDAAPSTDAAPDPGTDALPMPDTVGEDAIGEPEAAPLDATTALPEWPALPLVELRDLPTLERACGRRDWTACVALADRLADGPAEEHDEARANGLYVRACDVGRRLAACRRLGLRLLRAASSPAEGREAASRLEQACTGEFLDACAEYGTAQVQGERVPQDVYLGLQRLQRACNAGYAAACATVRTLRETAESYDLPLPRAVAPKPVEAGEEPPAEAACPALFHGAAAVAPQERLDRELGRLAPGVLAAAIPEAVEGWTVERPATPEGGPGARGTVVGARFSTAGRSVELTVRDRRSECTLQPGTGTAMAARTGRGEEGRRVAPVRGEPGVLAGPPEARVLTLWIADRCEVRWTATGVADDRLLELAGALDLGLLRRECERRETADGTVLYEP